MVSCVFAISKPLMQRLFKVYLLLEPVIVEGSTNKLS